MPLVPISYIDKVNGKRVRKHAIVLCTEKEYEQWKKDENAMSQRLIPNYFVKEYLEDTKGDLEKIPGLSKSDIEFLNLPFEEEKFMTAHYVRQLAGDKYDALIDAYCEHLKSL